MEHYNAPKKPKISFCRHLGASVMFYSSHATCIHTLRPPTLHHYKDGTRTIINNSCKLCRSMVNLMTHSTARHPPSLPNTLQQQSRHCMMTQSQPTNVNSSTPLHPFIQLTATSTCSSHHPRSLARTRPHPSTVPTALPRPPVQLLLRLPAQHG